MHIYKYISVAFTLDMGFKKAPLMGAVGNAIDSIYLPRGGSDEQRQKALDAIKNRQVLIEDTGNYTPILVFPEGGTTNGSSIVKFKKGAFVSEMRVKPIVMNYNTKQTVIPAYDIIEIFPLAVLQLSWSCLTASVKLLPDFEPTEYLFETFKDKGKERWEIFAWAAREVMMKAGNL